MKLNKNKPELVLDLSNVTGHSRMLLSLLAQTALLSMGFHWEPGIFHPVNNRNHMALHINSGCGCPMGIRGTHDAHADKIRAAETSLDVTVYDAATQLEDFLHDAEDLLPTTREEFIALDNLLKVDGCNARREHWLHRYDIEPAKPAASPSPSRV